MDLLNKENIKRVFREFCSNPSFNYTSVYNALTKNYEDKLIVEDKFDDYKDKWEKHCELFKLGFEPYTPCESNPGFYHVKSSGYDDRVERKHRIYINPNLENRIQFVHLLIKKFLENNIDYYFKYSRGDERTDNLLIYTTDEQLSQTLQVLKEVESEFPEIVQGCKGTPLSSTSLGWYAYGVEDNSSKKGSLSQRVAKIVRTNISKTLIENRNLYFENQIDDEAIKELCKACVNIKASKMDKIDGDIYSHLRHDNIMRSFKKNSKNLAKFILRCFVTGDKIETDQSVLDIVADNGEKIEITPSAISTMLAGLKPNFTSEKQREKIYNKLLINCKNDLQKNGLLTELPQELKLVEDNLDI